MLIAGILACRRLAADQTDAADVIEVDIWTQLIQSPSTTPQRIWLNVSSPDTRLWDITKSVNTPMNLTFKNATTYDVRSSCSLGKRVKGGFGSAVGHAKAARASLCRLCEPVCTIHGSSLLFQIIQLRQETTSEISSPHFSLYLLALLQRRKGAQFADISMTSGAETIPTTAGFGNPASTEK